jgi:hypothetical protein
MRPLVFILSFAVIWGSVFANRFWLYLKQTKIGDDLNDWVECSLLRGPLGVDCGGRPETYPGLCCAVPCRAVLCCAVLCCCAMQCCAVLCCAPRFALLLPRASLLLTLCLFGLIVVLL